MRTAYGAPHPRMPGKASLLVTLACLLAGGCASSGTPRQTADGAPSAVAAKAEQDRVEQVFVYQGRVANDLLERYQFSLGPEVEMDPVLSAAETRMNEACTYLNQAAVSYLAGGEPGWRLKMKVYASVDDCEAAADDVAALLDQESQPVTVSDIAH